MKKQILGALAGGAALFITGYLIYIIIFQNDPSFIDGEGAAAGARNPPLFPVIILMEIGYGLLMTLIFSKWANISTFKGGLWPGAWLGFLIGMTFGMWMYGVTTLANVNGIFYYALTFAVRFAVAGGAIGWVLGKVKD
ncbi:MAG: hypothetical protein K9J37_18970 [Saprospiraceae bacterium]|nr:hypothetical protein [Saprospiraceae bacterium]MCF8252006.1 hypothetical protein [Saprospiraceae bacterium]MCF8281695.1 hypothetical protein [Bacteroidales bacterium]MCF8313683.1 hypothetical protein [Saprospiraceae bacterium]MCF8442390.1 hypothetical protein [Saprospiraceae bacterium]